MKGERERRGAGLLCMLFRFKDVTCNRHRGGLHNTTSGVKRLVFRGLGKHLAGSVFPLLLAWHCHVQIFFGIIDKLCTIEYRPFQGVSECTDRVGSMACRVYSSST